MVTSLTTGCLPHEETATVAPAFDESDRCDLPPAVVPVGDQNLLTNPSFEAGGASATHWEDESTTVGDPIYSISTDAGVVDGTRALRIRYSGRAGDDGTRKAQFFQAPIRDVTAGQTLRFTICVAAGDTPAESMNDSYAIVGVEAFEEDGTYLSDVSSNVIAVDEIPRRYSIDYEVPGGSSYVAVFVQSPEFVESSIIDLCFDDASLVIIG